MQKQCVSPLPCKHRQDVVYTIILLLLLNETPGDILVHLGSHSTSPHDTVYNHASWRLFENHFYYLTRDVSTPGVGILGTWVSWFPRLTNQPTHPLLGHRPSTKDGLFLCKIHSSFCRTFHPSFYRNSIILLQESIHPSRGIHPSLYRNSFILLQ